MRSAFVAAVMCAVLVAGVAVWTVGARAATAVTNHFGSDSVGWGVAPTKGQAAQIAIDSCINQGAPSGFHRVWSKVDGPGWSAVYGEINGDFYTHSFRYATKKKAKKGGKQFCENDFDGSNDCVLIKVFYDQYGPQKKNGKPRRPGNRGISVSE